MSKNGPIKLEPQMETDFAANKPEMETDFAASKPTKGKQGRKKKTEMTNVIGSKKPLLKQELITDHLPVEKKKRKIDRFNGMPEEEVLQKTLPDRLAVDLDILIIGINPGLYAAYIGHHYAGPGNHFWKCLYLSGLVPEPMNCYDDIKAQKFGIGFTNMCARTTRGSADLKRTEIVEGANFLIQKLKEYKPKIAVFNGKGIYEVFSGSKKITFGKQPGLIEGTQTIAYVMPSSSARCAQLPRATDKVPFYEALRRLRDYTVGHIHHLDESEVTFPTLELKNVKKEEPEFEEGFADDESRLIQGSGNFSGVKAAKVFNGKVSEPQQKGIKNRGGKKKKMNNEEAATVGQELTQEKKQQVLSPSALPNFLHSSHTGEGFRQGSVGQPSLAIVPPYPCHPVSQGSYLAACPPLPLIHGPAMFSGNSSRLFVDYQNEFMSNFYSGSQHFGMVGFPNARASSQSLPNITPTSCDHDRSEQQPVNIKLEPADEPAAC